MTRLRSMGSGAGRGCAAAAGTDPPLTGKALPLAALASVADVLAARPPAGWPPAAPDTTSIVMSTPVCQGPRLDRSGTERAERAPCQQPGRPARAVSLPTAAPADGEVGRRSFSS